MTRTCVSCAYKRGEYSSGIDWRCAKVVRLDVVTGESRMSLCDSERSYGECGKSGANWEPIAVERAVMANRLQA